MLLLNSAVTQKEYEFVISAWQSAPDSFKKGVVSRFVAEAIERRGITAENLQEAVQLARQQQEDDNKVSFIRPVIRYYVRRGEERSARELIDSVILPGTVQNRPADEVAIFGRRSGRDMLLETLALEQIQRGEVEPALQTVQLIQELKRRGIVMRKLSSIVSKTNDKFTTVFTGYFPGFSGLSDAFVGGDLPDPTLPAPNFSKEQTLEFYRRLKDIPPYDERQIKQQMDNWYCSLAIPLAKTGHWEEARKYIDMAIEDIQKQWNEESSPTFSMARYCPDVLLISAVQTLIGDEARKGKIVRIWLEKTKEVNKRTAQDSEKNRLPFHFDFESCVMQLLESGFEEEARECLEYVDPSKRAFTEKWGLCRLAVQQSRKGENEKAKQTVQKVLAFPEEKNIRYEQDFIALLKKLGFNAEYEKYKNADSSKSSILTEIVTLQQQGKTEEIEKLLIQAIKELETNKSVQPSDLNTLLQFFYQKYRPIESPPVNR